MAVCPSNRCIFAICQSAMVKFFQRPWWLGERAMVKMPFIYNIVKCFWAWHSMSEDSTLLMEAWIPCLTWFLVFDFIHNLVDQECDIVAGENVILWYCGCWECDIVAGGWNLWLSLIRRGWPLSSAVSHYSRFTIIMIRIIIVNSDRTTGALFGWCEPRHFLVFTQPNQCHRITAITNIINATQGYSRN